MAGAVIGPLLRRPFAAKHSTETVISARLFKCLAGDFNRYDVEPGAPSLTFSPLVKDVSTGYSNRGRGGTTGFSTDYWLTWR
jgi:hypothetical protein